MMILWIALGIVAFNLLLFLVLWLIAGAEQNDGKEEKHE